MKKFRYVYSYICIFLFSISSLFSRYGDYILTPRVGLNSIPYGIVINVDMGFGIGANFEYMYKESIGFYVGTSYNKFATKKNTWSYYGYLDYEDEPQIVVLDYSLSDLSSYIGFDYYLLNYRKKFSPFIGVEIGYLLVFQKITVNSISPDFKDDSQIDAYWQIAPHFGVTYPISKDMFLNIKVRCMWSSIAFKYNDGVGMIKKPTNFIDYDYWSVQLGYSYIF